MARRGKSLFIRSWGPNDKALEAGLKWLFDEAGRRDGTGIVAVAAKINLENLFRSEFAPIFSALHKDGECRVGKVTLRLFTERKPTVRTWDGPILVVHGGQDLLDAVDSLHGEADVLYIPWVEDEHKHWVGTWNATAIGEDAEPVSSAEPTTGLAFVALQNLTQRINADTGIGHPSDREAAIRTLETLHHKNSGATPEQIRQQLIRLGWKPNDAQSVMDLAASIAAGRRPKGSTGRADENLWRYWESTVQSDGGPTQV